MYSARRTSPLHRLPPQNIFRLVVEIGGSLEGRLGAMVEKVTVFNGGLRCGWEPVWFIRHARYHLGRTPSLAHRTDLGLPHLAMRRLGDTNTAIVPLFYPFRGTILIVLQVKISISQCTRRACPKQKLRLPERVLQRRCVCCVATGVSRSCIPVV